MPTDNETTDDRSARNSPCLSRRLDAVAKVVFVLLVATVALIFILPALQPAPPRRSQAWLNLRRISLALSNYCYHHGAFPYDPRGGDYSLYQLYRDMVANGEGLDPSIFDSHPHDRPRREARWDHALGRIVDSDFDYWNGSKAEVGDLEFGSYRYPTIFVVERPGPDDRRVYIWTSNAMIGSCRVPAGGHHKLFGTLQSGEFLIANRELFDEWSQLHLPSGIPGTMRCTGNSLDFEESAGGVRISYVYQGERLKQRMFIVPDGEIIDTVTTDDIGIITGLSREPADWHKIVPVRNIGSAQ